MTPPRCGYRPAGPARPGCREVAALTLLYRIQRQQIADLERRVRQLQEVTITIGEALAEMTDMLGERLVRDLGDGGPPPPRPVLRIVPPPD